MLKNVTVFFAKCSGFAAGVVSQNVKGQQVSSKEAPILIMAPHSSFIEILAGSMCGLPGAVSTTDNARMPIIGAIFRANQSIFVERGDPESRSKATQKIKARAETNGAWSQLIVLPEGFCSNGQCLLPFKLGAFLPGVSVQPVTLKYNNRIDVSSWIDSGPGLLAVFSLLLCTPYTRIEVEFHPPYHPSEEEKQDADLFARNVRAVMSRYLNLPTSEMTYRDLSALVKRTKTDTGVLGFWKKIMLNDCVEMPAKEHLC